MSIYDYFKPEKVPETPLISKPTPALPMSTKNNVTPPATTGKPASYYKARIKQRTNTGTSKPSSLSVYSKGTPTVTTEKKSSIDATIQPGGNISVPGSHSFFSWEGQKEAFGRVGNVLNPFANEPIRLFGKGIDIGAPIRGVVRTGEGVLAAAGGLAAIQGVGAALGIGGAAKAGSVVLPAAAAKTGLLGKIFPYAVGGAGGLLLGGLFGGGQGAAQDQAQGQSQDFPVSQDPQQTQKTTSTTDPFQSGGESNILDSPYSTIYNIQQQDTYSYNQPYNLQYTLSQVTPTQTASQTARAEEGFNWLIPAAIVGGVLLLKN